MSSRERGQGERKSGTNYDHYHEFLVVYVPPRSGAALDIGYGNGEFASRVGGHLDSYESLHDPTLSVTSCLLCALWQLSPKTAARDGLLDHKVVAPG